MTVYVGHKNRGPYSEMDQYVGRPTALGNPFLIGKDGDREEVIKKYRSWFHHQKNSSPIHNPSFHKQLDGLKEIAFNLDFYLICWCHPAPCHADVIAEYLNGMKACYQCDKLVDYLFWDGRCGKCTSLTPEEVRGELL